MAGCPSDNLHPFHVRKKKKKKNPQASAEQKLGREIISSYFPAFLNERISDKTIGSLPIYAQTSNARLKTTVQIFLVLLFGTGSAIPNVAVTENSTGTACQSLGVSADETRQYAHAHRSY